MQENTIKESRLVPRLIYGIVILSVLLAFFLFGNEWLTRKNISAYQAETRQAEREVRKLETEDNVGALYASKQILEAATKARIEWSKVSIDMLGLESVSEDLSFLQVSVDPNGEVLIAGKSTSLKAVAILIQTLTASEAFNGPFVPSVVGVSGSYNFQIQFNYVNLK